ncbi:hypothetical protein BDZ89DRAFT_418015 [Hymenopellis radicata]|nr:hypothetical protein BDZ89DRAFT_418015 [Hymenopellis radicata]
MSTPRRRGDSTLLGLSTVSSLASDAGLPYLSHVNLYLRHWLSLECPAMMSSRERAMLLSAHLALTTIDGYTDRRWIDGR